MLQRTKRVSKTWQIVSARNACLLACLGDESEDSSGNRAGLEHDASCTYYAERAPAFIMAALLFFKDIITAVLLPTGRVAKDGRDGSDGRDGCRTNGRHLCTVNLRNLALFHFHAGHESSTGGWHYCFCHSSATQGPRLPLTVHTSGLSEWLG